jgi:tetratricopeptide (TPR) repeat protein
MSANALADGQRYQQAGDLDRAEAAYRELLRQHPDDAAGWHALGSVCHARRQLAEAAACYQKAVGLQPGFVEGHFQLGNAFLEQGHRDEAAAAYQQVLRLLPDHVAALANLGVVLGESGQLDQAETAYRRALQVQPHLAEVHHNLANLLRERGQLHEAVTHYQEALRIRPDYYKAKVNLGMTLAALGDVAGLNHIEQTLHGPPGQVEGLCNLGLAASLLCRYDESIRYYEQALQLQPNYAEIRFNLALARLVQGDFSRGWSDYEARWKFHALPAHPRPLWNGQPLPGQTLLLHLEQGLGDTIQFLSLIPRVKERVGRVVLQCPRPLIPLLKTCPGLDKVVADGEAVPDYAAHAPLLSLPHQLGLSLENLSVDVPYLAADPQLMEHWRRELSPLRGFRVGIAWQGRTNRAWDHPHRSLPLALFEPLAGIEGVQLISLQKGPGTEQLAALNGRFPVISLGPHVDETTGTLTDTAAIIRHLDLVISSDTAMVHLAGALAAPVWLALSVANDWRWLIGREDTPWYPTMRLIRQKTRGDWIEVFARMAAELRMLVDKKIGHRPIVVEMSPGDLLDRITILEIKSEHISDPVKRRHINRELANLAAVRDRAIASTEMISRLTTELRNVNCKLWQVQDELRACERQRDFGPRFVELAREVHRQKDRRTAVKRMLNEMLGSALVEEKAYAPPAATESVGRPRG